MSEASHPRGADGVSDQARWPQGPCCDPKLWGRGSPVLRLWAVEVVHWGVQPREDGWGDIERQLLVEESLLLGLQHEHFVIH